MSEAILFHGEPNGPSLSELAALEESGLEIECRPVNLASGGRHRKLHKREGDITEAIFADYAVEGEGPVLVIDGEAMAEAVFIAQYFDELAGGCGLQPGDAYQRWQMRMWCRQATERLAPAAAYLGVFAYLQAELAEMPVGDFGPMALTIRSEDLRQRWQELYDGQVDAAKLDDSKAKVAQFVERIENQLSDGRDWLMGDFSIADLETFAWLRSMRELESGAFESRPLCNKWMDRVEARDSVQAALGRSESGNPAHAFAPGPEINRWG